MKNNIHCQCGNFRGGEPFSKDQCAVCWGRDNYQRRKAGTFVAQVKQVSKATAEWIAAGSPLRTTEELAECNAICKVCPEYQPLLNRCGKCGCFLSAKARMATETCPIGKWPAISTTETKAAESGEATTPRASP